MEHNFSLHFLLGSSVSLSFYLAPLSPSLLFLSLSLPVFQTLLCLSWILVPSFTLLIFASLSNSFEVSSLAVSLQLFTVLCFFISSRSGLFYNKFSFPLRDSATRAVEMEALRAGGTTNIFTICFQLTSRRLDQCPVASNKMCRGPSSMGFATWHYSSLVVLPCLYFHSGWLLSNRVFRKKFNESIFLGDIENITE